MVDRIWQEAVGVQAPPGERGVLAAALLALALVAVPRAWHLTRYAVTIAHEGAHGIAALLSGRRLAGIRVHSDTSGLTVSKGRPTGPGMVLTAFAGYVGPALVGLGGAWLLREQHALAVLWLAVLLLALLLLQIRNLHGFWVVLVVGASVGAVTWWGSAAVQSMTAYVGVWFLLLGAPRAVLELQGARRRGRARDSDADALARITPLPAWSWVVLFFVVTLGCLVLGARWLWFGA